jgi:hypothetical protein
MEGFSVWHWIMLIIITGIFGYPVVRILRRAGLNGWWVLLWLIPIVNVVALWVFAYVRWPATNPKA